jgi:methionine synthase II (cobalamin-independent)
MPNSDFKPGGRPTLIGSLPLASHREALDWILANTPEIPLWPQLPCKAEEGMMVQFLEGIPCVREETERTFFTTEADNFETEQLSFYEEYLQVSEDINGLADSRFQVSRDRAEGLYLLAETAADLPDIDALKGQITGPFTQLTAVKDETERLGYYDPAIRDMVVKGLAMKAAWQVDLLKKGAPQLPILMFIDEPALAGLGSSSFISISKEDISLDLTEVSDAIHKAGGLSGVHVCANTDWNLLLQSDIDIISFDAFGFFDRFVTCREQIHSYLDRGGIIAWGIVPTSNEKDILDQTPESLAALWEEQAGRLARPQMDIAAILEQTLITPSCGTGSLSRELAERVLHLTRDTSRLIRDTFIVPTEE